MVKTCISWNHNKITVPGWRYLVPTLVLMMNWAVVSLSWDSFNSTTEQLCGQASAECGLAGAMGLRRTYSLRLFLWTMQLCYHRKG